MDLDALGVELSINDIRNMGPRYRQGWIESNRVDDVRDVLHSFGFGVSVCDHGDNTASVAWWPPLGEGK